MKLRTYLKHNYDLYWLLIPSLIFVTIFNLIPMYGITLAFKDYDMFLSPNPITCVIESPWVGFKYFEEIFSQDGFWQAFRNTIIISSLKLLFAFPFPIAFAILLSEIKSVRFQKTVQTIVYLPHFLSWVVVAGVFVSLLGSTGLVNSILKSFGFDPVNFLMSNSWFRTVLVVSDIWKGFGWGSIVYFAAIAGLDQQCYEAAKVDGANRFQCILHITLPGLLPTIVMMLILRVGGILDAGFDQVFNMYNSTVYETGDIIGTYIYRVGLGKLEFSQGTALGLFNSVIALILVLGSNYFAKKTTGKSIW